MHPVSGIRHYAKLWYNYVFFFLKLMQFTKEIPSNHPVVFEYCVNGSSVIYKL